ncbi:phosphoesterase family protein, putative [Ichthyophthirius multifiliis]|uniref:Phosphoesterase family protein, putative n=1 Tax=Ichthyophthirius multifiliis TaxID=5932 RepID=G0QT62_ICHMU|nr:phosphoesterase family protein, putative [Ichthyophthirius multifiliis]EGR31587.1 phosphoesterase family protein, putative [Ichthyophthirius multifiliis]|eukprot:XP_004035073.1 phosphoesterase family protein, putative [Ichthyophthirius multifiliis]
MFLIQIIILITTLPLLIKTSTENHPIKNIVVLMMENRSFDHMLGWMTKGGKFGNKNVDGLTGQECNPKNVYFPFLGQICVDDKASEFSQYDPDHGHQSTVQRIFGCLYTLNQQTGDNPCKNHSTNKGDANMKGFVMSARREGKNGITEMSMQSPKNVPILTTLANEYALFDNYFSSYPGPTNPNRLFMHSGTCNGCLGNEQTTGSFKNQTLQSVLERNGLSWRYYWENDADDWFLFINHFNENFNNSTKFIPMEQFYQDAEKGDLPNYTFINPSESYNSTLNNTKSFGLMNDQHPNHSIKEGERLIKNVYEALRNGPLWNQTLFIITYDEHGGFYDHVSPPQDGVPNPDGIDNVDGFKFNRLGIRVPMIAVSPWIEKNTLINKPMDNQKPQNSSQWEHSSIISTVLRIFNLQDQQFSKRIEWAAHFDDILKIRKEPRTDCVKELPYVPPPTKQDFQRFQNQKIKTSHQKQVKEICETIKKDDTNCGGNIQEINKKKKKYRNINFFQSKYGKNARPDEEYEYGNTQKGFNNTQSQFGSNPASLKGKLMSLEEMIKGIAEEMNFHKKEVQILKSEKDTLQSVLSMKTQDVKKTLTNELTRIEEEMKRHFAHQKAENARLQQQITSLKGEKTALQQQLLGLQRRITELELQVGNEEAN